MEIFDIVDENGIPTGEKVERKDAHRNGVCHRTAHVWISREWNGRRQVLLQKRANNKDSFPGRYDTSSAGHVQTGDEPLESAMRELYEELGLDVEKKDLKFAGTFHVNYERVFHGEMFKDNEVAFVYVYQQPVDIDALTIQADELECVEWFDLEYVYEECLKHNPQFCVPLKGLETARNCMDCQKIELHIDMPKHVRYIIEELVSHGYEAYAVGGCVRDAMLGRVPHDWDVTTSATPEQVKRIFHRTFDTGIEHGTVTVLLDHIGYEVTTYRIDGEYLDGRHPEHVEFTSNLVEDLKRRDFTINAMAYSHITGLVDEFDGAWDLQRGIIRCVGRPQDRFDEDALRILRAIRFSAVLGFEIEENTLAAICDLAGNLEKISKERIQVELDKLLMSAHPDWIYKAFETGVADVILPELVPVYAGEKREELYHLLKNCPVNHYQRWAALLCMRDGITAQKILKNLRFDNKTLYTSSKLVEECGKKLPENEWEIRKKICEIGEDIYKLYVEFMIVFARAGICSIHEYYRNMDEDAWQSYVNWWMEANHNIETRGDCTSLKNLAVNGKDLLEAGYERGKTVGDILLYLLEETLKNPEINTKEKLLDLARQYQIKYTNRLE